MAEIKTVIDPLRSGSMPCPQCGYDLRATIAGKDFVTVKCPECGTYTNPDAICLARIDKQHQIGAWWWFVAFQPALLMAIMIHTRAGLVTLLAAFASLAILTVLSFSRSRVYHQVMSHYSGCMTWLFILVLLNLTVLSILLASLRFLRL